MWPFFPPFPVPVSDSVGEWYSALVDGQIGRLRRADQAPEDDPSLRLTPAERQHALTSFLALKPWLASSENSQLKTALTHPLSRLTLIHTDLESGNILAVGR
jgi:hypothetical protein